MSYRFVLALGENAFEQQACKKPLGEIIQPYQLFDMPGVLAVIPRADLSQGKKAAARIFARKDKEGVGIPVYEAGGSEASGRPGQRGRRFRRWETSTGRCALLRRAAFS